MADGGDLMAGERLEDELGRAISYMYIGNIDNRSIGR